MFYIGSSFTYPGEAEAGFFSFISEIFSRKQGIANESASVNSQNMPLLRSTLGPDSGAARGGGDITLVGGSALLPETGPEGSLADIEETDSEKDKISLYVVREGDTVSTIARMFDVSVNTVIWANDLKSNGAIKPGDTLLILPVSGVKHNVKNGDTLSSIAKRYKADLKEIVRFNNLSENSELAVGITILVPDGEISAPPIQRSARTYTVPNYDGYYLMPVDGAVKTQRLHGYNGIDLASLYGSPVYAAAPGIVIVSKVTGWNGGYGKYIVIEHPNGTQTLYAHLSENLVTQGEIATRGEMIGRLGTSGKSTGPHLHFEVRGARNPF